MARSKAASDSPAGSDLDRLLQEEEQALSALGPDDEPSDDEDEAQDDESAAEDSDDDAAEADDEGAQPDGAGEDDELDDGEDDPEAVGDDSPGSEPESDAPQDPAQPTPESQDNETEPFRFRVDGAEVAVPGAVATKHGIAMPWDAWQRVVQPRLADRSAIARREQDLRHQIAALDPAQNEDVVRARALTKRLDAMLEAAEKGDDNALRDFLLDTAANAARLRLEVDNEVLRAQTYARTERDTAHQQEQADTTFAEQVETGLAQGLRAVLDAPEFKDLGIDAERAYAAIRRNWQGFVFKPQQGDGSGIDPSQYEWAVNLNAIREYLEPAALPLRRQREEADKTRRREAVRERNRKRLGREGRKPPTAVSRAGSPSVGGRRSKEPTTKEEWEASLYEEMRGAE